MPPGALLMPGQSHTNPCLARTRFGEQHGATGLRGWWVGWGHQGHVPAGPAGEALSLPGTLLKTLRRRPPPSPLATHTNYILYVFYLLCHF